MNAHSDLHNVISFKRDLHDKLEANGREGRSIIQIIYISSQTQYITKRTHISASVLRGGEITT